MKINELMELLKEHATMSTEAMQIVMSILENVSDRLTKVEERNKPFVKPTLEEIKAHCAEKAGFMVGREEDFFNFYESKEWHIGKSKMKNWKSAINTWKPKNVYEWKKLVEQGKVKKSYLQKHEPTIYNQIVYGE